MKFNLNVKQKIGAGLSTAGLAGCGVGVNLCYSTRVRYKREVLRASICWEDTFKIKCLKVFTFCFTSITFVLTAHIIPIIIVYWCSFKWTSPFNHLFLNSTMGVVALLVILDGIIIIIPLLAIGVSSLQTYVKVSLGAFYGVLLLAYSVHYDTWYRLYITTLLCLLLVFKLTLGKSLTFFNLQWLKDAQEDNRTVENHIKYDFPLFYYASLKEKTIFMSFGALSVLQIREFFGISSEYIAFYVFSILTVLFSTSILRIYIIFYCNAPILYNYAYTVVRPFIIAGGTVVITTAGSINSYSLYGPPGVLKVAAQHVAGHPSVSRYIDKKNYILFDRAFEVTKNPGFADFQLRHLHDPRYVNVPLLIAALEMMEDPNCRHSPKKIASIVISMSAKASDVKISHFGQSPIEEDTSPENIQIQINRIEVEIILKSALKKKFF